MFITTPNDPDGKIFRRHRLTSAHGRAVRPGFDYMCITGYHKLSNFRDLRAEGRSLGEIDIAAAPIDAPDFIPAGACAATQYGPYHDDGKRFCNQQYIWRE